MSQMRLRQVCLVAPHLEPVVGDITAILGLDVCYRDPHVEKYGLENALMPVDATLLEVVAPTQPGTAAGRFLEKSGGRGGYMVILSCEDPDERGRFAASIGVRTANVIDHPPYHGVQLHPRDCRAAFIEFNHTAGSDDDSISIRRPVQTGRSRSAMTSRVPCSKSNCKARITTIWRSTGAI